MKMSLKHACWDIIIIHEWYEETYKIFNRNYEKPISKNKKTVNFAK